MSGCIYEPDVQVMPRTYPELEPVIRDIRELQRQRSVAIKSRIMVENRLIATVAIHPSIGYRSGATEADRKKTREIAAKLIENIRLLEDSQVDPDDDFQGLVKMTIPTIDGYQAMIDHISRKMQDAAKGLPVAAWVAKPEQRGFGLLQLTQIIGECGDLGNYENPGKLWRRMGCAPCEKDGKMQMPSTWRRTGGLSAADWEELGYSPRRRSIMFNISDGLVKQNGSGPYRTRYVEAKVRAFEVHAGWKTADGKSSWTKCEGKRNGSKCVEGVYDGDLAGEVCQTCGGTGMKCGHAHNHGLLLAGKRLLKYLWQEWSI